MQILHTISLLFFTLALYNCQNETLTDTTELGSSSGSLIDLYTTSGDLTSCNTDTSVTNPFEINTSTENTVDLTSSVTMTFEQNSINTTISDTNLTSENPASSITDNVTSEPETSSSIREIPSTSKTDLGLILGLSLGLGIPVLFGITVGMVYYLRKRRSKHKMTFRGAF